MKISKIIPVIGLCLVCVFLCAGVLNGVASAAGKEYTVSRKTKPCNEQFLKFSTYNAKTRDYYLLRSYLEKLEAEGGGTLVVQKGTYTISNTLFVPSNVTIRFKNGVKLLKGAGTGVKHMPASKSMFQFIAPSRAEKKNIYGKYNGEKNISLIGEGTVIVDSKFITDSISIIMGHNSNIKIKNIQFKNMKSGHFIEMDASKNVMVEQCSFQTAKASPNKNKEAINLDTPDRATKGWSQVWSKFDATPNLNITIQNCTFIDLERSIGTHKYSGGKYHTNITIRNNRIENTVQDSIRVMNWKNPVIEGNTIMNVGGGNSTAEKYRAILMSGVIDPIIRNNTIKNAPRPIGIFPWKNSGPGSNYAVTYNEISKNHQEIMKLNTVSNVGETFIRINPKYNDFNFTKKIYLSVKN